MKRVFSILLMCIGLTGYAQNETVDFSDLKIPVSPAFSVLDLSPTSIDRPSNPKALGVNVLNFVGSGNLLPKNFALEFSPYWIVKQKNETVYKYIGISKKDNSPGLSTGLLRKMDLSLATFFNDSAKNFLNNTNYAGLGIRTNILTFWGVGRANKIRAVLQERSKDRIKVIADAAAKGNTLTANEVEDALEKNRKNANNLASILKPTFSLDASYAYSETFFENKYENSRFNRSAIWINGTLNMIMSEDDNEYFFLIGNYRRMRDNVLIDTVQLVFNEDQANDFGIRAGYENGLFSISVEHISRKYTDKSELNSKRTVGILQFKVNENIHLFGTFGKNFGGFNNLFTLFGISWGWGKNEVPVQ